MFEGPGLVKPLVWVVGAQALLYLLVLRPWRVRELIRVISPGIDVFAVLLFCLALMALLEPRPFDDSAAFLIDRTSLPDGIATIDAQLADLEQLPDRLWADLKATFGFDEPPPRVPPSRIERPGAVEAAVIGAVREIVSIVMRAYVYLTCVLSLWFAIIVRLFIRHMSARMLWDEQLLVATANAAIERGGGSAAE